MRFGRFFGHNFRFISSFGLSVCVVLDMGIVLLTYLTGGLGKLNSKMLGWPKVLRAVVVFWILRISAVLGRQRAPKWAPSGQISVLRSPLALKGALGGSSADFNIVCFCFNVMFGGSWFGRCFLVVFDLADLMWLCFCLFGLF